jgi:glycine oxidase
VETVDVIIGGGGIIGLSVALELAQNGLRVRVLEKDQAMSQASWAAAGMLSAHDPEHPAALTQLALLSDRLYPEYLRTVERLSGLAVPLRTRGTLSSGHNLRRPQSPDSHALSADQAKQLVPDLATNRHEFWWMEEPSLDPRDLCAALPLAVAAAGVELQQQTEVLAVSSNGGNVEVTTQHGTTPAGAFINCCGAWAARLQPACSVEPRKGQMCTVRLPEPLHLPYVLRAPEIYLVPRGDGHVVIGATVERAGFDRSVQPAVLDKLCALASEIWPPIASAPIVESWSGLRPGTQDDLPLIGNAGAPNCWVATGHFRNGILLAPATGLILRQLLQGGTPAVELDPFQPGRSAELIGK